MAGKQITYHMICMGCDPELFFERGGQIIGAEKVLPGETMATTLANGWGNSKGVVLDGVQVELNPTPSHCRANLGNSLQASFRTLRAHLASMPEIKASFRSVVEVDKVELDSLSDKAKRLGCAPSLNHYDKNASISVDPATYRKRSAGGHIHVGLSTYNPNLMPHREELVPLMDVLVGLPSVLIDRDPNAAERRQVYGRAGEHRLPAHGVEYRTLSNYWLRSYPLMSFVMGMARMAVSVLGTKYLTKGPNIYAPDPSGKWDAPAELLSRVDLSMVRDAINGNDLKLAKKAYEPVRAFIKESAPPTMDLGLRADNLDAFDHFVEMVEQKGIEYWFPQDPIEHWSNMPEGHARTGWEAFLAGHVSPIMNGKPSAFKVIF